MNISDLTVLKECSNLTLDDISSLSGIPVDVVEQIFSGEMQDVQYATLLAIEEVLVTKKKIPFTYDYLKKEPVILREETAPYCYNARRYQREDIEKLSAYVNAELINGYLYMMSAPSRMHQFLIGELFYKIKDHIRMNKGECHIYTAPFDVRLFGDDSMVVEPDLLVICDKSKLTEKGCLGAPDWIIEIVSESNSEHDYVTKMMYYQKANVREYWIVDPYKRSVLVYYFENFERPERYSYEDAVCSSVMQGLKIRLADFEAEF